MLQLLLNGHAEISTEGVIQMHLFGFRTQFIRRAVSSFVLDCTRSLSLNFLSVRVELLFRLAKLLCFERQTPTRASLDSLNCSVAIKSEFTKFLLVPV